MIDRFDKLRDICADVNTHFNNPKRDIYYHAYYGNLEKTQRSALRLAGLASFQKDTIIEIGVDSGLGAMAMALGVNPEIDVWSCDIREESIRVASQRAADWEIKNVHFVLGDVSTLLRRIPGPFSMAYIDGDHSMEPCLNDLTRVSEASNDETLIVCDDFYDLRTEVGSTYGVSLALRRFMIEHPEWYGLRLMQGFFALTRSKYHPVLCGKIYGEKDG